MNLEELYIKLSRPMATIWLISNRGEVTALTVDAYVALDEELLTGVQVRLSAESAAELARQIRTSGNV